MSLLRSSLLDNIEHKIIGCDEQIKQLSDTVNRFVSSGEGGSVLVLGERGCGKTTVIESVLSSHDQLSVVRLSGFLQCTDKLAFKEIAVQLQCAERDGDKENCVGDDDDGEGGDFTQGASYADYFTTLLASCSRPGESRKKKESSVRPSVVFVLDEFDLFAQRVNQILLYTLLDATRSADCPAALLIVGVTCRHDVTDLLEKRVRSRLDNRQIQFHRAFDSLQEYVQLFEQLLTAEKSGGNAAKQWNTNLKNLVSCAETHKLLETVYHYSSSPSTMKHLLRVFLSLCDQPTDLRAELLTESAQLACPGVFVDCNHMLIQGLPLLDLCLLVCIHKLDKQTYGEEPFNFEIVYKHFMRFARQCCKVLNQPKEVVLKSMERLASLGLIAPSAMTETARSTVSQDSFRTYLIQVDGATILEVAEKFQPMPMAVREWIMKDHLYA